MLSSLPICSFQKNVSLGGSCNCTPVDLVHSDVWPYRFSLAIVAVLSISRDGVQSTTATYYTTVTVTVYAYLLLPFSSSSFSTFLFIIVFLFTALYGERDIIASSCDDVKNL